MSIGEPKRIAAIAVMSIAAALFGWLAVARRSGATLGFDLAVRTSVHRSASPAMTALARVVATVGSPIFLSVFFAIAIPAFHRVEWKRAAVTLAEVMAGAVVCNVGLKRLIHCPRPEPFVGRDPSSYSFPSGHALYSLCFYGVLASVLAVHAPERAARVAICVAAAVLVAGIGLSRVYLGVHYPSDVIAGYLGAVFVLGAVFAFSPGWS
jgi:undecaprenyl-diphosphatase